MCACVYMFVCECVSGPSDDLEGLLQLHDQLPIRFLHLISEPVLQSVNGRPCDLKTQKINPKLSLNKTEPAVREKLNQ